MFYAQHILGQGKKDKEQKDKVTSKQKTKKTQ